jgi:hypothetical protein
MSLLGLYFSPAMFVLLFSLMVRLSSAVDMSGMGLPINGMATSEVVISDAR